MTGLAANCSGPQKLDHDDGSFRQTLCPLCPLCPLPVSYLRRVYGDVRMADVASFDPEVSECPLALLCHAAVVHPIRFPARRGHSCSAYSSASRRLGSAASARLSMSIW